MRAVCSIFLVLAAATAVFAEDFPYPAVVTAETSARCGPGENYYRTTKLAQGTRVEVYRKQGSWLGIRPLPASFSWAPASQLQTTAMDDVMVAREDGVRVWIGTNVVTLNKHHFQIELKKGEAVQVIGEKRLVAPSGAVADTWYKILPPAGEFRWLPVADLRRDNGEPAPTTVDELELKDIGAESSPGDESGTPLVEPPEIDRLSDAAPTRPRQADSLEVDDERTVASSPAPNPKWLQWQAPTDAVEFDRTLEQFSTTLATMVALPTENWDFTELRIKVGKMADAGPSPLHRAKARKLQASIGEFQAIAERLTRPKPSGAAEAMVTNPPESSATNAQAGDSKFAGQGWLMPVHSSQKSVPKFTILDDQGRFLQFVSPAPGVNLRRYEKQRVGVIGPASYIPALDRPHITAQRVVPLR